MNEILVIQEELFKIIGNQKRLEIILLLEQGELNVTEMSKMLGLKQANLSQHLTLLRSQKIVNVRKSGRESYYKLADESLAVAIRSTHDFLSKVHHVVKPYDSSEMFPIVVDPVCGMRFSASKAFSHLDSLGIVYYFCASGCQDAFSASRSSAQVASKTVNA